MDISYLALQETFRRIKYINDALAILSWDKVVIMPKGSIESRANQIATLKLLTHDTLSSTKILDLINNVDESKLDDWNKVNFYLMQKIHKQTISVDKSLTQAHAVACAMSEMIWRTAKAENNFKQFSPFLKEVISLTRQVAFSKAAVFNCSAYDDLLETYDPGLTTNDIDPIFNELRQYLPDLIARATEQQRTQYKHKQVNKIALPIQLQQDISLECMKLFGFDFNKRRLDTSDHPFCGGISEDTRITTKYKENDFIFGLISTLHETGHALYQQQLPSKWIDQPIGSILGMATHESQSLIFEYQVCRSKEFIHYLSNLLQTRFGLKDDAFKESNLYQSVNTVTPSLIRIEADEVTYPAHVILRYDLEKAMISGDLAVDELPIAWNDEMHRIFGIRPSTDTDGCLQDIHWPSGIFGYFPSYLIGAIMAAKLYNKLNQELPDNNKLISMGKFHHLNAWLSKNVHQCGSRYTTQELLVKATGQKLNLSEYKKYLSSKFDNIKLC